MADAIDPRTGVGTVSLTVRDLATVRGFYERVLGMEPLATDARRAVLGAAGRALVELVEDRAAPPRPPRTTGLFHLAVLVPDRGELARSLHRLAAARWPLAGTADHLVSEALYLDDPEGNGIEIYRDRPREQWRRDGDELRMATLPLDLEDLVRAAPTDAIEPLPSGTRIGHVHLNVAELAAGERFYAGLLGMDVTARGYPGALFLSAGGYHHHVGLNIWRGAGAPAPPRGALGLRAFELALPDADAHEDLLGRLRAGGVAVESDDGTPLVRDPSGNALRLVVGS